MRSAFDDAVRCAQPVLPVPPYAAELTSLRTRTEELSTALAQANGALEFATMCHVETELRAGCAVDKSNKALEFCHQRIDELER